jgi:hypothetical protein
MDTADESDEELKLAIALSLQDEGISTTGHDPKLSTSSSSNVIDLVSVEETPLRKAPAKSPSDVKQRISNYVAPSIISKPSGLFGLDRKAMEQERIARKRKANEISTDVKPDQVAKPAILRDKVKEVGTAKQSFPASRPSSSTSTPSTPVSSTLKFAKGAVKKTWCFGYPRKDDIKLEEVLDARNLNLAVLSAFQWDVEWVLKKITNPTAKMVLVMQAKEEATRKQYEQETSSMSNLRLCFPPMPGQVNCMHSKLMLLSYTTHLRVVIPSANLMPYDWGETGVMENMVFLIDLPRLPQGHLTSPENMTFFGTELIYFCTAMNLGLDIVASLYKFDFSATACMAFVHTIGGEHKGVGDPWRRTGYCGLGRAIQNLGLKSDNEVQVDWIASSIGAVKEDLLISLYLACQGDDGMTEYSWRKLKASSFRKEPRIYTEQAAVKDCVKRNLKLYFPSRDTVFASKGGPQNAGTICFQSKWYDAETFPKTLLYDYQSARIGLLMHTKVRSSTSKFRVAVANWTGHICTAGRAEFEIIGDWCMDIRWICEFLRKRLGEVSC